MKLTLAMGLQYDSGKKNSLFAMSVGQDQQTSALKKQDAIMPVDMPLQPDRALPVRSDQHHAPVFLTYNMKGFSDTLVFQHTLLDVFV